MGYLIDTNAKNVWVRDNADTEDLSVMPNASSVYFNNGRTMEQEFGKGAMSSNIATVDSGVEKVIDGTYDGAYESCKMCGRTLKSLFTRAFTLDPNKMYSQISESHDDVQIEVGKEYTVIIDVYKNNSNCSVGFKTYGCTITPRDGLGFQGREIGRKVAKVVFTEKKYYRWFWFETNIADEDATEPIECELTVIDGDYRGMVFDHFEGLCDVKAPILKNVGKNLFPPLTKYDEISKNVPGNECVLTDNKMTWNSEKIYTPSIGYYFNLKSNTKYTFSCNKEGNPEVIIFDRHSINWDANHLICAMSTIETTIDGRKVCNFTTRSDGKVCIRLSNATGYTVGCWIENCYLTEASISNAHVYEDYKTNILETSNDLVLRGLPSGIRDTYDCLTGEYIRRVGERDYQESDESDSNVITDLVKTHYELAEPIITTIEPPTTPFAYENGHIILESGHEGQSLLPTLEYQTVVSRSGQVTMIDKTIQQHERKITLLEKMLVQNIIDIEYKNTLLALKLEINEVI